MSDNITADAAFTEINKTHAIVLHNCRCMVFIQSEDSNHLELVRSSTLLRRYANDRPMLNAFKLWMKSPSRREYPCGIYLKPMGDVSEITHSSGAFNFWRGRGEGSPEWVFAEKHGVLYE